MIFNIPFIVAEELKFKHFVERVVRDKIYFHKFIMWANTPRGKINFYYTKDMLNIEIPSKLEENN